jgi:hypothetical protein
MTTALVVLALAAGTGVQGAPSRARVVGIAGPLILAPFCGAPGVPLAAVAGAWLVGWSARGRGAASTPSEDGPRPAPRALLAGLGLACWCVVAAYLYGYHGNPGHPAPAGVRPTLRGLAEFLSVVLGSAGAAALAVVGRRCAVW